MEERKQEDGLLKQARFILCKDCIHRGVIYRCPMLQLVVNETGIHYDDKTRDDGYCDRGEGRIKDA